MLQRLTKAQDIHEVLRVGLLDLMSFLGADRGNVQLLGRAGELVVVAQHGLSAHFLEAFRRVSVESPSVCGRAAAARAPVFVPEVSEDAIFAPHLPVARNDGITSILSCPLTTPDNTWIGVISAHFALRAHPTPLELQSAGEYGQALAEAVDQFLPRSERVETVEAMADDLMEAMEDAPLLVTLR